MGKTTYRIPESVVEDTLNFRHEMEKYLSGETSAVAFRALRVPMGIYEQRENDTYMVRVRGAAGVFLPDQIKIIADLAKEFGNGIIHATTRQDLQIHRVRIEDTPTVLERLLDTGLSSRGGGGNTVRNVSACPNAGVCSDEVFDVTPYALALTEYLIAERANFNLPRKFKSAFSGCSKDCGLCSVADLGFFAHEKEGVKGFSVYAGGGMGSHSALGILIEEFIPAESIFEVAEAVKRLFDKYGDRTNRNKARLRFVVERFGTEDFRKLYRQELDQVRIEGISTPKINLGENAAPHIEEVADVVQGDDQDYQTWRSKHVLSQKQQSLHILHIPLKLGEIESSALRAIADLAAHLGNGTLRTTQNQDLRLRNVPEHNLRGIYNTLKRIDVSVSSAKCISCAGASTCKLGLCLSRGLATAIESELVDISLPFETHIKISGCPNSCGHHPIAPIGLYGGAARADGRLYPIYFLVAGGRTAEGNAALAQPIAKVPAKAVPALMREFWTAAAEEYRPNESTDELILRWGEDYLHNLAKKYDQIPTYESSPDFYRDFGSTEDFSLAGRGPGECGAGVMDVISLDIEEAANALETDRLYDAILSTARALLVTNGLEPKKDREVFAAFAEHFIAPGWVNKGVQSILDAAVDYKLEDRGSLSDLRVDIEAFLERVKALFRSLDSNLNFRIEPVDESSGTKSDAENAVREFDLRGVSCPMNFVRAKLHLEELEVGDVMDILLDAGEPVRNVPASFADQGQEVLSVTEAGDHFRVKVKRMN